MIIYNVTVQIAQPMAASWLTWLTNVHIPDIMQTGCFCSYRVLRLLEIDDSEGPTYTVQYTAESKALYNRYIDKFAPEMRQRSFDKWGNNFIAFRSLMQIVE